jgi:putative nucleotidyltransferase with HDIG domain
MKPGLPSSWIDSVYPEILHLSGCMQDPRWHAEGDVLTHTKMVADSMYDDPEYGELPDNLQKIAITSSVLHDIGKTVTTRTEPDGSITSKKHSVLGRDMAIWLMIEKGWTNMHDVHHVASLVRTHQWPRRIVNRPDPEKDVVQQSQRLSNRLLWLLAKADENGRRSGGEEPDIGGTWDNLDFYRMQCEDTGCFDDPYRFPHAHARFKYMTDPGATLHYHAHDDRAFKTVIMCGLPGSGKSTWIAKSGISDVVSLDDIREEIGVGGGDSDQSRVLMIANERMKVLLRKKAEFVWDATNIRREFRQGLVKTMTDYGAEVHIVCMVDPFDDILYRDATRNRTVGRTTIEKMRNGFQFPEMAEAHRLIFVRGGTEYNITDDPY